MNTDSKPEFPNDDFSFFVPFKIGRAGGSQVYHRRNVGDLEHLRRLCLKLKEGEHNIREAPMCLICTP